MKKQWKRLLFAAMVSSSIFAGTWFWYQATGDTYSTNGNEKPLAYVGKVMNDIQRRPASRLLWQLVDKGEPLYNGEAIRTSEDGEVRIQFADSDRFLDLEPESLIVIKKMEGDIALDLMEGSLFINAKQGSAGTEEPGLVLNSANGVVDLSKASVSLTKTKGKNIDVQILEGSASIKQTDGSSKNLSSQTEIKIHSPALQKPVAMNAESPEPVAFEWDGFPEGTKVTLWLGSSRKNMTAFKTAESDRNSIETPLAFGRHYWKLVGTNTAGEIVHATPVYKSEVLARYAPTVVFPTADVEIPTVTSPFDMNFQWQKTADTRQMTLEVWTDPSLQNRVTAKSFSAEENYTLPALQPGTYFWRMTAYYVDSTKPLLGKIQKFTVKKPEPVATVSDPDATRENPVTINFDMPNEQATQFYLDKPVVDLAWTADKKELVNTWRVRIQSEDQSGDQTTPIQVKDSKIQAQVAKPGRYLASIEALDANGSVMGKSITKTFEVTQLPLLKAPGFLPAEGDLQAASDGRSTLEWNPISGAKEYWLTITKDGKELKRSKYGSNSTSIKNLLPGEYDLSLSAVDSHGRISEASAPRKLIVPDKSNVRAPTLKKIKVH